jgi:hypothetical protein
MGKRDERSGSEKVSDAGMLKAIEEALSKMPRDPLRELEYDGIAGSLPDWLRVPEHVRGFYMARLHVVRRLSERIRRNAGGALPGSEASDLEVVAGLSGEDLREALLLSVQLLDECDAAVRAGDRVVTKERCHPITGEIIPIRTRDRRIQRGHQVAGDLGESLDFLARLRRRVREGPAEGLKRLAGISAAAGWASSVGGTRGKRKRNPCLLEVVREAIKRCSSRKPKDIKQEVIQFLCGEAEYRCSDGSDISFEYDPNLFTIFSPDGGQTIIKEGTLKDYIAQALRQDSVNSAG